MLKGLSISILLGLLAFIPTGCQQQAGPEPFPQPSEHFKRQEAALTSWGYVVKKRDQAAPTEWEKATFGLQHKKSIFVKSQSAVPGVANTYYRFTLTEEIYADQRQAKYRVANLFQKPPDFDMQDEYSFGLRKAYQHDNYVYVIGTDAILFEKELQRLAKQLEELLRHK